MKKWFGTSVFVVMIKQYFFIQYHYVAEEMTDEDLPLLNYFTISDLMITNAFKVEVKYVRELKIVVK